MLEGRHFLHEHHEGASSWNLNVVQKFADEWEVVKTTTEQCQYGLKTPGTQGRSMPAMQPTGFVSSAPEVLERLSRPRRQNLSLMDRQRIVLARYGSLTDFARVQRSHAQIARLLHLSKSAVQLTLSKFQTRGHDFGRLARPAPGRFRVIPAEV